MISKFASSALQVASKRSRSENSPAHENEFSAGALRLFLMVTTVELLLFPGMLIWSPVATKLEERLAKGEELKLIIVPFIKVNALIHVLKSQPSLLGLKVVVRWRPEDLLAGVSDLEAYEYLKSRGCALFLNSRIHLKLYIFGNNTALCTSANLTMKGLGLIPTSNIEAGCSVELGTDDWRAIYALLGESRLVNDEVYAYYKAFLAKLPKAHPLDIPPLQLPRSKIFTIASLPATNSPREFMEYHENRATAKADPELVRRAAHDETLFLVPPGISGDELREWLSKRFRCTPFVSKFVEFLKVTGSLRFGAANDWIHSNCEDSPLPYRWELKESTHILYNWLAAFYGPNISWSVPGKHSQVIVWRNS